MSAQESVAQSATSIEDVAASSTELIAQIDDLIGNEALDRNSIRLLAQLRSAANQVSELALRNSQRRSSSLNWD